MQEHNFFHYFLVVILTTAKAIVYSLIWLLVGLAGLAIFQSKKSPFDLLIGLPLILIGVGFVLNSLQSIILSLFSPAFNRGICFLCKR